MIKSKLINRLVIGVAVCVAVFFPGQPALATDIYGTIYIKDGVPMTPSPAPTSLPTNILFFKTSNPSPVAAGLTATSILAGGTASDASYQVVADGSTPTITVMLKDTTLNRYGRVTKGKNTTSGLTNQDLTFPGGSPKNYELQAFTGTWYKMEPPPAPTLAVEILGYTPSLQPMAKFTITAIDTSQHEVASVTTDHGTGSYLYRIRKEGTTTYYYKSASGTISPDPANALATGMPFELNATYEVEVAAKNWFALADETNLNWSSPASKLSTGSLGPGVTETTQPYTLNAAAGGTGVNTLAVPFITGDAAKPIKNGSLGDAAIGGTDGNVSVRQLIEAINATISGGTPVKTFGWWDETQQKHIGLTALIYDGTTINTGSSKATDANGDSLQNETDVNQVLNTNIEKGRPYQVGVNQVTSVTLKGYRQ